MFMHLLNVVSVGCLACSTPGHVNRDLSASHLRSALAAVPIAGQDSQPQPKPWSDDLQAKLKAAQEQDQAEAHQHRTVDLPSLGPIKSPHDTSRGTVGTAHVSVAYGRPSMRGRTIFGQLVPYDQVWRTGANEATLLTTDKDITIGGLPVPAGTYSLYTIPAQSGWQLIINREVGQWGLSYHEEFDYGRVAMTTSTAKAPVEKFLIDFPKGKLRMQWATTVAEVPVAQKR